MYFMFKLMKVLIKLPNYMDVLYLNYFLNSVVFTQFNCLLIKRIFAMSNHDEVPFFNSMHAELYWY